VGASLTQRRPATVVEDGRRHAAALIAHKVSSRVTTRLCACRLCPAALFVLADHDRDSFITL